jgi:hypothetical protein
MRPERAAGNCVVLIVPEVKVKMEAHNSIPPLSVYDLLGKHLPLTHPVIKYKLTVVLDIRVLKMCYLGLFSFLN